MMFEFKLILKISVRDRREEKTSVYTPNIDYLVSVCS